MSNITPPNETPKDVNNRLHGATGLNPDNPNDMTFKLVTILYFFVCHKNSFFLEQRTRTSPPFVSHSRVVSHCVPGTYYGRSLVFKITKVQVEVQGLISTLGEELRIFASKVYVPYEVVARR
jgi:hypothetical protein